MITFTPSSSEDRSELCLTRNQGSHHRRRFVCDILILVQVLKKSVTDLDAVSTQEASRRDVLVVTRLGRLELLD